MTKTVEFGKDKYHLQYDMEKWCKEHIGKNPLYTSWVSGEPRSWEGMGTWCMSTMFGTTFFYFKEEKDAVLFALRWS